MGLTNVRTCCKIKKCQAIKHVSHGGCSVVG